MPDRGADTIGAIIQRLNDLEARLSGAIDGGGSSTTAPAAHLHDAADVGYTPSTLTDWDGDADPGDSADALDQLAERVDDLEGGAGHDPVTLAADADTLLGLTGQELSLDPQNANKVLAGPTAGGDADPTFRALVDADIPADIARDAEVSGAISTHEGLADPHTGYVLESAHTSHHDASEIIDDDADTGWEAEQSPDEDRLRGRLAGVETIVHFRVGSAAYQLVKIGSATDPDGRFLWRTTSGLLRLYRKTAAGDDFDVSNYTIVMQVDHTDGAIEFSGAAFTTAPSTLFDSFGPAQYQDTLAALGAMRFAEAGVTVASGAFDQSDVGVIHTITGEGSVADVVDTINELSANNWIMLLRCADPSEPITLEHGTGNLLMPDGADIVLDDASKFALAIRDENIATAWRVIPLFDSPVYVSHAVTFHPIAAALSAAPLYPITGHCVGESGEHGALFALRAKAVAGTAGAGTNTIVIEADSDPAFPSATTLFTLSLDAALEVDDATLDNAWDANVDRHIRARCTAVDATAPQEVAVTFYFKQRAESY